MKVRSPNHGHLKLNSDMLEVNPASKHQGEKQRSFKSIKSKEEKAIVFQLAANDKSMLDNIAAIEEEISPQSNSRKLPKRRLSIAKKAAPSFQFNNSEVRK